MSGASLYVLVGAVLFVAGAWAAAVRREAVQRAVALNVLSSGVFLVIIGLGARAPGTAPDPVAQALVLTGLVVAVAVSAAFLALAAPDP